MPWRTGRQGQPFSVENSFHATLRAGLISETTPATLKIPQFFKLSEFEKGIDRITDRKNKAVLAVEKASSKNIHIEEGPAGPQQCLEGCRLFRSGH